MKIAIIGSGNVGGALATKWINAGHDVLIGARMPLSEKNLRLAGELGTQRFVAIDEAVRRSDIILLSVPATSVVEVVKGLGDTSGKIIIDTMNIVMGRGPLGYQTTTEAILAHTKSVDVVKCFNITGYNNLVNSNYGHDAIDMFVAGDSVKGSEAAIQLAHDAGFENCFVVGGNDKFELMEQFAWFWINLAMFQGMGREIGFKLLRR